MPRLIYVCTGNICRSPFAERLSLHLLNQAGQSEWHVESAGIGALVGEGMEPRMRGFLEKIGGNGEGFTSRQLTPEMLSETDLIVTMESGQRSWILEEMPANLDRTFTLGQAVRYGVEQAPGARGPEFIEGLRHHRSRAMRRDDVIDPYRKSDETAAKSAFILERLLTSFVPRLYV